MKFFAVSMVGLGVNTLTLWVLGLVFPAWYSDPALIYVLKLVAIAVTTMWNCFANLLFTFRGANVAK